MIRVYCDSSTKESCFVIQRDNEEPEVHIAPYEERQTNNTGEYLAVIRALEHIRAVGIADFGIFTDSKLVVNQIKDFNKCKVLNLSILRNRARDLLGADHIMYKHLRIEWLPRETNPAGLILEKR
jgi:ribonuclease HI